MTTKVSSLGTRVSAAAVLAIAIAAAQYVASDAAPAAGFDRTDAQRSHVLRENVLVTVLDPTPALRAHALRENGPAAAFDATKALQEHATRENRPD